MKGFNTPCSKRQLLIALVLCLIKTFGFSQITVSGQLKTELGLPVGGFAVLVSGTENKIAYTDMNGVYSFELQQGGDYEIQPLDCNDLPLNGVSTMDLILMSKHILQIDSLSSPYKIIAADVDDSGVIDTMDILILRSLIFSNILNLPNGNFRFVLEDYVFPDPIHPSSPPYPRTFTISNLQSSLTNIDFIAIKVGDVSLNYIAENGCNSPDFPTQVTGKVFRDETLDCLYSAGELPLAGWKVSASNDQGTFYGISDAAGNFVIKTLPGVYDISLITPNDLWSVCMETVPDVNITLSGSNPVDFAVQPTSNCPSLVVDLSISSLRRCISNSYNVEYCNEGTATAENASVELTLDPLFSFQGSTIPATTLGGNTYQFNVGNVASGECGNFWVTFILSCDAILGQTHCTEAHIFPDSICGPGAWNGPDLHVTGVCDGNDVRFTITNHGSDMIIPSSYIVIEDIVVMIPPIHNPFTLAAGESEVITIPANGTTVRLEVDQAPGHPWSEKASATIEGCGTNASGSFSLGLVNNFPLDDQSPFSDIDCRENTGSFDPNDKQGFPFGALSEHFIPMQQPIEYLIRFQNTGTDTAFSVVIKDTLDGNLDVNTIRPLGGSHPYLFNLNGTGIAQFSFHNIMLPDSNTNERASHGYIKFSIAPKASLPEGTIINNDAAIYFDFNKPVITNRTWHTLGTQYLSNANYLFAPGINLEVYPNPASRQIIFNLNSAVPLEGVLQLYDVTGKLATVEKFSHNQITYDSKNLKSGYYMYRIVTNNKVLATGKVIKVE